MILSNMLKKKDLNLYILTFVCPSLNDINSDDDDKRQIEYNSTIRP